jgi:hypothetical protein
VPTWPSPEGGQAQGRAAAAPSHDQGSGSPRPPPWIATCGGLCGRLQAPTYPHLWRPKRMRYTAFNVVCSALDRFVTSRMTDGTRGVRRTTACVRRRVAALSHRS